MIVGKTVGFVLNVISLFLGIINIMEKMLILLEITRFVLIVLQK